MVLRAPLVSLRGAVLAVAVPAFKWRYAVGETVPIPMLPFCLMTKRGRPEEEAVKRSPEPLLSTRRAAKEVWPDMEAAGVVPDRPRTSRVARGEVVPMPTEPPVNKAE